MTQPQILVTRSRIGTRDVFALAVTVDAEPVFIDVTPRGEAGLDRVPVIVPFDLSRLALRAPSTSEGAIHDPHGDADALLAFARYLAEGLFAATAPMRVDDDVIEGFAA